MEDFSLNLLCKGQTHLLASTLDSLKPQAGSFEIVLLDGEGGGRLQEWVRRYEGLKIRVQEAPGLNLAQMMNLGVSVSGGKYVQFLRPGDRYISQYGLSFLTELIQKEPPHIAARCVLQDAQSHWLLKKSITDSGGFDERLIRRPLLDLLCRLEKKGVAPLFCPRVLIDSVQDTRGSLLETFKVLCRHFGLGYACKQLLRGRPTLFRRVGSFLKGVFWGGSDG